MRKASIPHTPRSIVLASFIYIAAGLAEASCAQSQAKLDVSGNIKGVPCTIKNTDVPVDLGQVKSADFKGPGQRLRPVSYQLELLHCPRHATIHYQLDPQTPIIDETQAVIALQGGPGTATNVGLQLMTDDEKALPLKRALPVPGYDPNRGGDLSIPLKVAFYQTAAGRVGGGIATASATFTLSYP
jgi:major type 1 subunit fimbrin (pilin)